MFRPNNSHLQRPLSSDLDRLSPQARTRLEESWAEVFYREFFCRLDESPFAVLYADIPSRPNTPVNVLVGLESLKAGFGWSDEEMHDAFLFDVQVRYALGYRNLGEGEFDLRTVYNFRDRLINYMLTTGENLMDKAFVNITDEQIAAFQLHTGRLRMDSSQIASNIRRMSRLQLLVEVLQRVHRMLNESDQALYADAFAPYLKGSSGQYVYHLRGEEVGPHLQCIGELMHRLLVELAPAYAVDPVYQMLQRVFHEQFILSEEGSPVQTDNQGGETPSPDQPEADDLASTTTPPSETAAPTTLAVEPAQVEGDGPSDDKAVAADTPVAISPSPVRVRPGQEISPHSLRSPDDPEATYRKKGNQAYEGYATNISETCAPDNPFQLIVKVQTAPNTKEDTTFLLETLPELKARTNVETLYNDGGFCSPEVDELLHELQIEQVPTALRGKAPDPNRTTLADCHFEFDTDGRPVWIICPHGHTVAVEPGRSEGRYIARWAHDPCDDCHFPRNENPADGKAKTPPTLRFSQTELDIALRRQRSQAYHRDKQNLRAAIEATVGAIKRPFNDDQLPVRGTFRVGMMMIGSATMVNIRRIQRYLMANHKADKPEASFFFVLRARFLRWLWPNRMVRATVALGS